MTDNAETIASLDAILEGDSEGTEQVGKKETEVEKTEDTETTKEQDPEETKGEESEPPAEKDESEAKIPVKAQQDERRKRQAAEKKAAELEAELAELKKQKTNPIKEPDPVEDPEGAHNSLKGLILQERINLSREMLIDSKPDYLELEKVFVELAKQNPSLVQQMNESPNPAKFAYTKAKEHTEYQDFLKTKDSEDYKAFLESKKKAESEKELEETPEEKRKKSAVKVPDLVNATSGNLGTKPVKRETLDDILG